MMETAPLAALRMRLTDGRAAVGVAGLGCVGLPLAVELARAGFRVTGIDPDQERVRAIARGESPIEALPAGAVAELVKAGRLQATSGWDVTPTLDAIVICVPTPLTANREPDLSFVRAAAAEVAGRLRPGQLVVLESTTYPGTTEEVLLPLLEAGGLRAGQDFALAYSPERVDPGNPHYHVANPPKLVGGVTPVCTALAQALYEKAVTKMVPVSGPRVAETAKLLENVFRNVNIALVNELAMLCDRMGVDVWEVVEAVATKPFGFMRFLPGPGVEGTASPSTQSIWPGRRRSTTSTRASSPGRSRSTRTCRTSSRRNSRGSSPSAAGTSAAAGCSCSGSASGETSATCATRPR